jgi:FKBP-type peptidyl-prolyl cis-trans isomerase 2
MAFKKSDFIELEFTGRLKTGEIFDSNIKEDLETLHKGHNHPVETKPFVMCLGEQMFLDSVENFIIGKEIGEYELQLPPEKAFGTRNSKLVMMIPMKVFREQKINPVQGDVLNFDGRPAKILTVSGGRIIVDFNNPLAGKEVIYKLKIKRKVDDLNEKIKAMINFFFRKDFEFEVKEGRMIMSVEPSFTKFAELFKDQFKKLFNLELEVKEIKETEKEKLGKKIQ